MKNPKNSKSSMNVFRHWLLLTVLTGGFVLLAGKAVLLQWEQGDFLKKQGDLRMVRNQVVKPNRGRILDRNGEILAVSTPVDSVFIDPLEFCMDAEGMQDLSQAMSIKIQVFKDRCQRSPNQRFAYVRRLLPPEQVDDIISLDITGVYKQREYRRYYPLGPVTSHVIGFTNIEDRGLAGVEIKFDDILRGSAGHQRLVKDNNGNVVAPVVRADRVENGKDLEISIDARIQFATRRALRDAMRQYRASSAAAVVLDSRSGEILSLVNLPDFNPNLRNKDVSAAFRNRAVADSLEPGSTMKPFTIAMALESGHFSPDSIVETSPGKMRISGQTISDIKDYGTLNLAKVVIKSSNIGTAKVALQFKPEDMLAFFAAFGFGQQTGIELPGEHAGKLPARRRPIEQATMSYGYGLTASPLQLARAYTVLANNGVMVSPTLRRRSQLPEGRRVISESTARSIVHMLERVASTEGTARRAKVAQYTVAGKTGTTHKLINGNYKNKRYVSSFAGFAPASDPRFVMVVVIDDPKGKNYYGGLVAAPVFSRVMAETLRVYNVSPDDIDLQQVELIPDPLPDGGA
ncbi:MAG: cell division protein FtsI (penicillin-binding protein 3) [Parasphingorhabdus sp.]|jgi:cell division protein FtsI (penicillin-binding protein 3)